MATASQVFAERAAALNALATQAIQAKQAGDSIRLAQIMAEYQKLRSQSSLSALATQARVSEMPSDFMQKLASVGDQLTAAGIGAAQQTLGIFKNLPLMALILGVAYLLLVSGGARRLAR